MFQESDFDAYAALCADPDVMRYLGEGKPLSRAEAWRQMALLVGHWPLRGYGMWAVEERASGQLLGRIGCWNPEGWPDFEVGWVLRRQSWGKGYATEGARAALRFAFQELGRAQVVSLIHPDNVASIRVAERLGESPIKTAELFGHQILVYGINRSEWQDA
jgi:RimJ/RimL family protein N-acetyltransferase